MQCPGRIEIIALWDALLHFSVLFSAFGRSGGGFFLKFYEKGFENINMYCIFVETKSEQMQAVTFFMPVNLETGHPNFVQPALWIGRAIITHETDYDDNDQPFTVDVVELIDLFWLPYAGADIKTARRVELPDGSKAGFTFRYKLQQAAILAYHNPQMQPAEMPDEPETVRL